MCTSASMCMYECIYLYVYECIYVWMHICLHECVDVFTYVSIRWSFCKCSLALCHVVCSFFYFLKRWSLATVLSLTIYHNSYVLYNIAIFHSVFGFFTSTPLHATTCPPFVFSQCRIFYPIFVLFLNFLLLYSSI